LAVVIGEGVFDAKRIEFLLPDKINRIVGRDPEQPRTESKVFFEPM
jgi:hypothetical protein